MRISDWSSAVCSSDLAATLRPRQDRPGWRQALRQEQPPRLACGKARRFRHGGRSDFRGTARTVRPALWHHPARGSPWIFQGLQKHRNGVDGKPHQAADKRSVDPDILEIASDGGLRSEEHTSELQSLMRNSYAVFCLK